MTLVLAIACSDRVVVAADGRSTDYDTGKPNADVRKIYELTPNSAILVAGNGLIDDFSNYVEYMANSVRKSNHQRVSDIAKEAKGIIDRRDWAEWKDLREKSYMDALVVGYDDTEPKIYIILDNRNFQTDVVAHAMGGWDEKMRYLKANLSADSRENTRKQANKVAVEMLSKAEDANPKEIGGEYAIWHIRSAGIDKLDATDVVKLKKRYGNA